MSEGMYPKYDVIVAGAGPGGAMAAFMLAGGGARVLLLEKERFPRYKPCGGGITFASSGIFPYSLEKVIQKEICSIRFTRNFGREYLKTSEKPLMYCTMRQELDSLMVENALEAGAVLHDGEKVIGISRFDGEFRISTDKGLYFSRYLVGADGPRSLAAASLGINPGCEYGAGIESEVVVSDRCFRRFSDRVCLDWGTIPFGYAWIFPKKDHLSVGVGASRRLTGGLKQYYLRLLENYGIEILRTESFRAHTIPYLRIAGTHVSGNALLVGDAAGLTDPMTGEGIGHAVHSGQLAARVILDNIHGRTNDITEYQRLMKIEILDNLMAALPVLYAFHAMPGTIHRLVGENERAWRGFCKVMRGEIKYGDIAPKLGNWRIFWPLLQKLGKRKERLAVKP